MSSLFAQIMEPGGGVMLLPFVRVVIGLLMLLTSVAAVLGVARIHMVILSFLSGGLLLSLYFFESEYNKMRGASSGGATTTTTTVKSDGAGSKGKTAAKTD